MLSRDSGCGTRGTEERSKIQASKKPGPNWDRVASFSTLFLFTSSVAHGDPTPTPAGPNARVAIVVEAPHEGEGTVAEEPAVPEGEVAATEVMEATAEAHA